jgi:hypothetical protein
MLAPFEDRYVVVLLTNEDNAHNPKFPSRDRESIFIAAQIEFR